MIKLGHKILIIVPRDSSKIFLRDKNIVNINCGRIKSKHLYIRGLFELFMEYKLYYSTISFVEKFKPDQIICYSPSIFFKFLIKKLIKKFNAKSYLILRDIFPYWAIECGYINNFFIKKFYIYYFQSFLKIFDKIGVESFSNIKYLKKKTKLKNVHHLPNWIKIDNHLSKKTQNNKKSFIFSGNLGGGQDLDKLLNFYSKLKKNKSNFELSILGKGMQKISHQKITSLNIKTVNKVPYKKFISVLCKYDYGVISLKEKIISVNYPGKLLTYLGCGLPIVLLSNKKNELTEFIIKNKIGVVINDIEDINQKIKYLNIIKNNFFKNKTHIKILKKFFSVEKNILKILK